MTVPEHTPDTTPAPSRGVLRRMFFGVTALALTATFALTLSGIASTEGTLQPGGHAATLAGDAAREDAAAVERRDCPRGGGRDRGDSGRV